MEKGSTSVEFVMAFLMTFIGLLIVMEFFFLAVAGELASYAAYMGSRAIKANIAADVTKVVQRVVPWVQEGRISWGVSEGYGWVRIKSGAAPILGREADFSILAEEELELDVISMMPLAPIERTACEDNPLWYVGGDEPCGN